MPIRSRIRLENAVGHGRSLCRPIAALTVAIVLAACQTADLAPLTESPQGYAMAEDERRLVRESDEYERRLRAEGLVLEDRALQDYITGVGSRLIPPGLPKRLQFHFGVLREPTINAFALPQGGVYLNMGLLVRLESEAQLAHVLAHEIMHTVERHQIEYVRHAQNRTVAAKIAQMMLMPPATYFGGSGLIGPLISLSWAASVTGYGRERERQADLLALRRIAAAGYAIEQAPRMFELLQEVEDAGALEGFFYASHPANRTREQYSRELIGSGSVTSALDARVNREQYQSVIAGLIAQNIRLRLQVDHYGYALKEAERALKRDGTNPWLHYYAGEAHRLIALDPEGAARENAIRRRTSPSERIVRAFRDRKESELAKAEAGYRRALELDRNLALAHRGLGLVARMRGDAATARRELQSYLDSAVQPSDRRYIEQMIKQMADG